ncbi:sensor histidine kinase [Nocardioides dongxiaopingii]|uniref:sensor histidine kinase n=1 Tax=Nocardioides sp. S-1144 TaxID=2582905 RepID=UPI0011629640|nr:sensor histidine kinase [Nocardioides sp. S-1144]QDH10617.1 sensor histidine kinase [Nocardioides sp. S-1144]
MESPDVLDRPRQPWRLTRRGERRLDVGLVVLLLLPAPLYLFSDPLVGLVVVPLQALPLLWRRTHAGWAFAGVALASALQVPLVGTPIHTQVAFPVAVYSAARFAPARTGFVALGVGLVAAAVASLDWITGFDGDVSARTFLPYFLTVSAFVVTGWALGTLGRTRRAYVEALVERGERIRRDAEQQVALAASAERARIAREMHDVVAHGLTVMVVQADGARYAAAQDPAVATDTLARIAATGREALTDMRQLLGLLRAEESSGRSPLPGLDDLPGLLAAAGTGGDEDAVHLDVDLVGLDQPVPTAAGLTAYRVVQEALTNVHKHAGPGVRVRVSVHVAEAIRVEVVDDGRGAAAPDGGGHGLLGMRERVDVHGGTLETGPRPDGGFGVRATIPL